MLYSIQVPWSNVVVGWREEEGKGRGEGRWEILGGLEDVGLREDQTLRCEGGLAWEGANWLPACKIRVTLGLGSTRYWDVVGYG